MNAFLKIIHFKNQFERTPVSIWKLIFFGSIFDVSIPGHVQSGAFTHLRAWWCGFYYIFAPNNVPEEYELLFWLIEKN